MGWHNASCSISIAEVPLKENDHMGWNSPGTAAIELDWFLDTTAVGPPGITDRRLREGGMNTDYQSGADGRHEKQRMEQAHGTTPPI
jgi:hypothetical protein